MQQNEINKKNSICILEELKRLESILQYPKSGMTRKDFERMITDSFYEIGTSGRVYNKELVLDVLEERLKKPQEVKWKMKDSHCLEIAKNNYLLTYTLKQGKRITRRSTIWRKYYNNWKIVWHQGTVVEDS